MLRGVTTTARRVTTTATVVMPRLRRPSCLIQNMLRHRSVARASQVRFETAMRRGPRAQHPSFVASLGTARIWIVMETV